MIVKKNEDSFNLGIVLRYSLCLLLLAAPFARGLFFETFSLPFIVVVAILFVLSIYAQVQQKEPGFFNHPLDWAMLCLLLTYVISLLAAVQIRSALAGVMKYAAYVMFFWVAYRIAIYKKGYDALLHCVYFTGVGMAVFSILIYCGIVPYPFVITPGMLNGTLEYHNTLGIYMAAISLIGWGLLLSNRRPLIRSLLAGGNAVLLMTMVGSLSRGTWIIYPFAVLAFVLLVESGKRLASFIPWLASLLPGLIMARWFMAHSPAPTPLIYAGGAFILAGGLQAGLDLLTARLYPTYSLPESRTARIIAAMVLVLALAGGLFSPSVRSFFTQGSLARLTQITLQDQNVQDRLQFYHDALKIIKDHPLIGVGAEGWQALYHHYASRLYWSSKTHNYFLQTWVESGTLGILALMAVWITFFYLLWKYHKQINNAKNPGGDTVFWSAVVAVFALGAHSLIDFDMSYPAVAFLLFGLMGALKAQALDPPEKIETARLRPGKKLNPARQKLLLHWRRQSLAAVVLSTVGALILASSATLLWIAGFDFITAQTYLNKDPAQALIYLDRGLQNDSLNAGYWAEMASILVASSVSNHGATAYRQALQCCAKAERLAPYDLKVLDGVDQTYIKLGEYDKAVNTAHSIIRANPWDPSCYESLANIYVMAGLNDLTRGQSEKARSSWQQALKVQGQVPATMEVPAVGLDYTSGQARLLLGEKQEGEKQLRNMFEASGLDDKGAITPERSTQIKDYTIQSRIWLAAALELAGKVSEAREVMAQVPAENQSAAKGQLEQRKTLLNKAWSIKGTS